MSDSTGVLGTLFSPVLNFFTGGNGEDDRTEATDENSIDVNHESKWEGKEERVDKVPIAMQPVQTLGTGSEVSDIYVHAVGASGGASVAGGGVPQSTAERMQVEDSAMDDDQCDLDGKMDEEDQDGVAEYEDFNPYAFIKSLPPYHDVCPPLTARPVFLPKKTRTSPPITLVLDLDETLVHCSIDPISNADLTFKVDFNGTLYDVYVRKRPHFLQFLEHVSTRFEVVVFTASQQVYAERLLNILDPTRKLIKYRLYRDSCLCVEGNYLKDLTVLGRDLSKVVLVDNSPHAFGYQVDNGIPIESWFDSDTDQELLKLIPFLERLHGVQDVRSVLRKQFQLQRLVDQS